jgi:hypothetical protein
MMKTDQTFAMNNAADIFDHFFRNELSPDDRQLYKGRLDLNTISQPGLREMLINVQEAFQQTVQDLPEIAGHVAHPPFHFDYIDSTIPNALAFLYKDFAFVGVTLSLVVELFETCVQLSRAEKVGILLGTVPAPEKQHRILKLCHDIQLSFVFAHEYTHIVHGHMLPAKPDSAFADEVGAGDEGSIELQAHEIDADAYATFLVVNGLLDGPGRPQAIDLLNIGSLPEAGQDLTIFGAFVLAVGAFFYLRVPDALDEVGVYALTHPPFPVRMDNVMRMAITAVKRNREHIAARMTLPRFNGFMQAIALAIHGEKGISNWDVQVAFLQSDAGIRYVNKLTECFRSS